MDRKKFKILIFLERFFLLNGNNKKAKKSPNPKCMARAGTSMNTPKPTIKGKGDAYHNWKRDQIKATQATSLSCQPNSIRALPSVSSDILLILLFFIKYKKSPPLKNKMRA